MKSELLLDQVTNEELIPRNKLFSKVQDVLNQSRIGLSGNQLSQLNDPARKCGKEYVGTLGLIGSITGFNLGYRSEFFHNVPQDIGANVHCDPFDRLLVQKIVNGEFSTVREETFKITDLAKRMLAMQNFAKGMIEESEILPPDAERTNFKMKEKASMLLRQIDLAATIFWGTPEQVNEMLKSSLE